MTSKIKILCQNLVLWEDHFDLVQGKKTNILEFLKLVVGMFRGCQVIISGHKSPIFTCIISSKVDIWPIKSKFYIKFLRSERVILIIFRVKKTIFWSFWKLFSSCTKVVLLLFLALKALIRRVFSAWKFNTWTRNQTFSLKTRFLRFFESCFGDVQNIFNLRRAICRCILSLKGRYMTYKIKILVKYLSLCECYFDHFND